MVVAVPVTLHAIAATYIVTRVCLSASTFRATEIASSMLVKHRLPQMKFPHRRRLSSVVYRMSAVLLFQSQVPDATSYAY